ncbi:Secretion protein HlyD family protein [Croceitalea dokdonensis DOKDO 023]|uniref:Secretion protein HlyD family protein n=1 Tax=Croceitalea dokdonensis DOKDO 023 TaxID=1300341 RepID=A0A0P7A921_9FLAO|nr:HlyD family efflux transporter periplasmic adaptor subunit [Croceitalea dokdonensis]KPM33326.1 Secretion protein HlyD family protein [Croceitalea dokdonensis DOKDO 023]
MQLFPKEIIESTTQYFIPKNAIRSKVIYGIILGFIFIALGSLPFIHITIYSSARGFVKPSSERIVITAITSGVVESATLEPNTTVVSGDTLLILKTAVLQEQVQLHQTQLLQAKNEQKDLMLLIKGSGVKVNRLATAKYQKQYVEYESLLDEHYLKIKQLTLTYDRNKTLLEKGVIAKAEFDEIKLSYDLAKTAFYQLKKRFTNQWQANLTEINNTIAEINSSIARLELDKENYVITAPVTGTLLAPPYLEKGSTVNIGAMLGEISPDTDLIAECYVSTTDIGLIDKNKTVNFQIDAFNYNQWGFVTGEILSIGKDVEFLENQPVYKVKCKLKKDFLTLKNGYRGEITKGMTLNARFEIAERSVYELLYDKMDDWLNPNAGENLALN